MELTPQALHDVEFREARRGGYNTRDVDDFLERVAIGVGQLQDRLREAYHRAEASEARLGEAQRQMEDLQRRGGMEQPQPQPQVMHQPGPSETDETLRRTLVLAQRTADATIKEAQEEANRVLRDAETHAEQVRASAETDALRDARVEVDQLADSREVLLSDIEALERHLDEQRNLIRNSLDELQRLVEEPTTLRVDGAPPVTDVPLPRRSSSGAMTPSTDLSGNGALATNGSSGGLAGVGPFQPPTEPMSFGDPPAAAQPPADEPDAGVPSHDPSVVAALQELHGEPPASEPSYESRPPLEARPPFDERQPMEARPPFDERQPMEARQPFDERPPLESRPSFDERPPSDERPPLDSRPPLETRPPFDERPSFDERPPLDSRPPLETRPPFDERPSFDERPPLDSRPPFGERQPQESRPSFDERPPLDSRPPLDTRSPLPQRAAFPAVDQPPAQPPATPPGSGAGFLPDLRAAFDPPPERQDMPSTTGPQADDLAPIDAPPPPPPPPFDGLRDVGGIPIEPGSRPSEWGRGVFDTEDEEEPRYGRR